jgi:hypothetical protein
MKDFCENTDLFQFEEVVPFLKKRGWALLNVALWWKQYIGSGAAVPHPLSGSVSLESKPVNLRSTPLSVERGV